MRTFLRWVGGFGLVTVVIAALIFVVPCFPGLPEGWATLLGAFFGALAIAWQARVGLVGIRESQERQAREEREAQQRQYEIEKKRREDARMDEARTLAAALQGELMALVGKMQNWQAKYWTLAKVLEKIDSAGEIPTGTSLDVLNTQFAAPFYHGSIGKIGVLGTSLAIDVAEVYAFTVANVDGSGSQGKAMDAKSLRVLYESYSNALIDWAADILHVSQRLHAFTIGDTQADPGPLLLARKAREAKKKSEAAPSS